MKQQRKRRPGVFEYGDYKRQNGGGICDTFNASSLKIITLKTKTHRYPSPLLVPPPLPPRIRYRSRFPLRSLLSASVASSPRENRQRPVSVFLRVCRALAGNLLPRRSPEGTNVGSKRGGREGATIPNERGEEGRGGSFGTHILGKAK